MNIKLKLISISQICCLVLLFSIIVFSGCDHNKQYTSPPYYNLNKPYVIKLPSELDEISGIAYYRKDNSLFAESDAKGSLYKIFLNKPTDIRKWKFDHKRDFEDIVLHDSTFYILNNNGDIVAVNFSNDSLVPHEYKFPENGKYEFETLCYDDQLNKLLLICKDCEVDKNATTSTYTFDPQQKTYEGSYTIDVKEIAKQTSPNSTKFKPSGAAFNPVTGEMYILSSINKLLVVAVNGVIKKFYRLNPQIFNHPEGITFTPGGDLIISNEAGTGVPATILFYKYQKEEKE